MTNAGPVSIAVIGIGCRLSGNATDPESLYSMLAEGHHSWTEVPETRYNWRSFHDPNPETQGCMNHRGGHFITQDVAAFDADFFDINPNEAKAIDPQQRLLLETSYEAVEDAGIRFEEFKGSKSAVYGNRYP